MKLIRQIRLRKIRILILEIMRFSTVKSTTGVSPFLIFIVCFYTETVNCNCFMMKENFIIFILVLHRDNRNSTSIDLYEFVIFLILM